MPSMPHPDESSHSHHRDEEIILGVDTHKDSHVAAVITVLGVLVASAAFPATTAGYRQLLGARGSVCCTVPGWKVPVPTGRR